MAYLIVVLAVLARFISLHNNFSPVYGALLFGGAHIPKRHSLWFPVAVLAASDLALTRFVYHMHTGWGELVQLAAFTAVQISGGPVVGMLQQIGLRGPELRFGKQVGAKVGMVLSKFKLLPRPGAEAETRRPTAKQVATQRAG